MPLPNRWAVCWLLALCVTGRPAGGQSADSAAAAAPGSTRLEGTVIDAAGQPVVSAQVVLLELGATGVTNAAGGFAFVGAPAGWYTLIVRRIGYQMASFDVEMRHDATTRVRYRLAATGHVLDPVRVTGRSDALGRLRDFEHRRASSLNGSFFTAEDIRRHDPNVLTDLLRRARGVKVTRGMDGEGVKVISSRGMATELIPGQGLQPKPCELRMAVDGLLLPAGTSMDAVPPRDIAGVEVYAGPAAIPLEFSRTGADSFCGLVVVWTK